MAGTGLPGPWVIKFSRSKKREYFFNPETKESVWEAPSGSDEDQLKTYLEENPLRVRALHLLIKHKDSRRPASHRNENITITKDEAKEELETYMKRLQDGETFESLAKERSDCSSAKRGGDLGFFGRGDMQPSFEKAAFALQTDQVSDIVESESGLHIIKRVA
ncbi:unnamed protein product [Kluyveromyces dobzhanskii CBS 2104]|uniref:Peptidyl-prolyl cis-trans isomerase n=1 Tax=Kluyveromyces dobzhanskii CBS 2104 TaxID=1427455 RepID=A0A0A8L9B6_9SACH|nr:unnamed protein product [Kluyveromyces dobzhanskii CBS 2104]